MSKSASYLAVRPASACRRRWIGRTILAAALVLLASPLAFGVDWEIEWVDDAINWTGSSVSVVVGGDGTPHIAHGMHPTQIIRYAFKQGEQWLIEEADVYPSGLCAAIALDPDGVPCLVYAKGALLVFARRGEDTWSYETIDALDVGTRCALRIWTDGTPHVAYCKSGDPWNLKHAWKPTGAWVTETADPTVAAGNDVAMELDQAGNPHISHWAAPNYGAGPFETSYTWWDGGAWRRDVVDKSGENCNVIQSGIALDSGGNPHIAYFTHHCWESTELRYAVPDAGGWSMTILDDEIISSAACQILLDHSGRPHVVHGTQYSQGDGASELRSVLPAGV